MEAIARRLKGRAVIAVAVWAGMTIVCYLFWQNVVAAAALVSLLLGRRALWLVGIVLAVVGVGILLRTGATRGAVIVGVGFIVVWQGLHRFGDEWGDRLWLYRYRPRYEAVVDSLQRSLPPAYPQHLYPRREFYLAAGPPLRVAFRLPDGLLDNYSAFVYDPTGAVMLVNGYNYRVERHRRYVAASRVDSIVELFDGEIVWCKPKGGPWYLCRFT
jgi:hypothetical protein